VSDEKENIVSRQTVDAPIDVMEQYDRIRRKRGFRSFGAYVVSLVRSEASQGKPLELGTEDQQHPVTAFTEPAYDSEHKALHDALETVLSEGTEADKIGITSNLEWAVTTIRGRPKRRKQAG
jgi:hypothetical protein